MDDGYSSGWNLLAHTRNADDCSVPCTVSFTKINSSSEFYIIKFSFSLIHLRNPFEETSKPTDVLIEPGEGSTENK